MRLAVVISNSTFNAGLNVVLLAISTQKSDTAHFESLSQKDLQEGTLLKESYIRFANIISLEKKLVQKKVGVLKRKKCRLQLLNFRDFLNKLKAQQNKKSNDLLHSERRKV